ncbi:MAG: hypothetical protein JO282_13175 [Alphaproteobacteria bacterium]|nr:hypothetical protein [Alphaproteobacteria bacterium]
MSRVPGFALPAFPAARDQKPVKPVAIVARILRSIHALSDRRQLDRAVSVRPSRHPAVPTFFPFDVRHLIAQGWAEQRDDPRSR